MNLIYAEEMDIDRYNKKKEILIDLHGSIIKQRDLHKNCYLKYKKYNTRLSISISVMSAISIAMTISGIVFYPMLIIGAVSSGTAFILNAIKQTWDCDGKYMDLHLTHGLLDDLQRSLINIINKNGISCEEMENIFGQYNDKLSIILSTSIL